MPVPLACNILCWRRAVYTAVVELLRILDIVSIHPKEGLLPCGRGSETGLTGFDFGIETGEASRGPRSPRKRTGKPINAEPELALAA
jgi:hypothetical protein